ncbi:hypothetical protein E2C01_046344 [Portunus trituberculatus]|uniref:Uncharacterized protein n=1 Tax=Portunus trituberculatus TaxID=210409 RepID=A0A5B7G7H7_PORTR|nr:hypothetical protein [Portunus trituberculatus]
MTKLKVSVGYSDDLVTGRRRSPGTLRASYFITRQRKNIEKKEIKIGVAPSRVRAMEGSTGSDSIRRNYWRINSPPARWSCNEAGLGEQQDRDAAAAAAAAAASPHPIGIKKTYCHLALAPLTDKFPRRLDTPKTILILHRNYLPEDPAAPSKAWEGWGGIEGMMEGRSEVQGRTG